MPTFMSSSPHQDGAGQQLSFANNWLREGIFNLCFGSYWYPPSVEVATLDKRAFHGSYPPGTTLPVYGLLKILDLTGVIPDFYQRGKQLLLIVFLNYLLHFLLTLMLCSTSFIICKKIGFCYLNSTLLAISPAIIQFHNAGSLYWHHLSFYHIMAAMLPFVLLILLELLHIAHTSPRVLRAIRIIQPIVMFWGVLTDWIFVFVIITVYIMRIIRKEIPLPFTYKQGFHQLKKSVLFFAPALIAVAIWLYQITYYFITYPSQGFLHTATSSNGFTLLDNILFRMGMFDGIVQYISYLRTSLYDHVHLGYGGGGLLVLYATICLAISTKKDGINNIATTVLFMLFIPVIAYHMFFAHTWANHKFSSLTFSPALSMSFMLSPIFIMRIARKHYLISAINFTNKKNIAVVTLAALCSSIIYAYSQIYNKEPVTKMFSPPAYHHVVIGNFVRQNTQYEDVVFSSDYCSRYRFSTLERHFTNKPMHCASNIDHIYQKIKEIDQNFTVKILYMEHNQPSVNKIDRLLRSHNIRTSYIKQRGVGGLLVFDGVEFRTQYEQIHKDYSSDNN